MCLISGCYWKIEYTSFYMFIVDLMLNISFSFRIIFWLPLLQIYIRELFRWVLSLKLRLRILMEKWQTSYVFPCFYIIQLDNIFKRNWTKSKLNWNCTTKSSSQRGKFRNWAQITVLPAIRVELNCIPFCRMVWFTNKLNSN